MGLVPTPYAMEMSLEATIKISPETRDALNVLKRGVETQDAVIRRLIRYHVEPIVGELAEWMRLALDPILEAESQ